MSVRSEPENGHEEESLSRRHTPYWYHTSRGTSPEVPIPSSTPAHRTVAQTRVPLSPLSSPEAPVSSILGPPGPTQGHTDNTSLGSPEDSGPSIQSSSLAIMAQRTREGYKYAVVVDFHHKHYLAQRQSVNSFLNITLQCNSPQEFRQMCFDRLSRFIQGTFIMEDGVPISTLLGDLPAQYDVHSANIIVKNKKTKNTVPLNGFSELKNSSQYVVTVFTYGPCQQQVYNTIAAKKQSSNTDRAGATSIEERLRIKAQLQATHDGISWHASHDANWMMWASHILSQPQEKREALISGDPPESFLNALLFRRPGTAAEQRIQSVEAAMGVAHRAITGLKDVLTSNHERVMHMLTDYETMIKAVSSSLSSPNRLDYSEQFAAAVRPQIDIDHLDSGDDA